MHGVVVGPDNVLQHVHVTSSVFVREISPHPRLESSDEALGTGGLNVGAGCKSKEYALFFQKVLENFVGKFFATITLQSDRYSTLGSI